MVSCWKYLGKIFLFDFNENGLEKQLEETAVEVRQGLLRRNCGQDQHTLNVTEWKETCFSFDLS